MRSRVRMSEWYFHKAYTFMVPIGIFAPANWQTNSPVNIMNCRVASSQSSSQNLMYGLNILKAKRTGKPSPTVNLFWNRLEGQLHWRLQAQRKNYAQQYLCHNKGLFFGMTEYAFCMYWLIMRWELKNEPFRVIAERIIFVKSFDRS